MSRFPTIGADTRNKGIAIALFAAIAAGIVYYDLFAGGPPNSVPNAPVATGAAGVSGGSGAGNSNVAGNDGPTGATGHSARKITGGSAALDPALHMEGMLTAEQVEYSGVGRNIFSPNSAPPVVIPKPMAPARPMMMPPPQPVRTGPPPPPPIDLTFFGTETDAAGKRQAILLHQDTVYTAQAGDVVLRRYRILSVDARSMQVEDMLTNSRQTLSLVAN